MTKYKVMTIMGTRPEIIRLSEIIKKLDMYTEHVLVHTGQSYDYELSRVFFDELKIREPDHTLAVKADSVGRQVGNILAQCEEVLIEEKPDAVLILGDTNSALSCIIAKRLGIRVIHIEAGNRCFNDAVPEEINRRIVDHTSDVNLCYTEHARRNLLREGLHPKSIFVIGSPLPEVYNVHKEAIQQSEIHSELDLVGKNYLLVSLHREENITNKRRLFEIIRALGSVGKEHNAPVVFSTHPRTSKELESMAFTPNYNIILHKPFGMFDYISLQQKALCNLSDSGTIHEDAALFDLTAVNVRNSHERPETYDMGNVIMSGADPDAIIEATKMAIKQKATGAMFDIPYDYVSVNCSDKVVRLILSTRYMGRE